MLEQVDRRVGGQVVLHRRDRDVPLAHHLGVGVLLRFLDLEGPVQPVVGLVAGIGPLFEALLDA